MAGMPPTAVGGLFIFCLQPGRPQEILFDVTYKCSGLTDSTCAVATLHSCSPGKYSDSSPGFQANPGLELANAFSVLSRHFRIRECGWGHLDVDSTPAAEKTFRNSYLNHSAEVGG
jgi:hypothetical protein